MLLKRQRLHRPKSPLRGPIGIVTSQQKEAEAPHPEVGWRSLVVPSPERSPTALGPSERVTTPHVCGTPRTIHPQYVSGTSHRPPANSALPLSVFHKYFGCPMQCRPMKRPSPSAGEKPSTPTSLQPDGVAPRRSTVAGRRSSHFGKKNGAPCRLS